jgi:hypothetical protein
MDNRFGFLIRGLIILFMLCLPFWAALFAHPSNLPTTFLERCFSLSAISSFENEEERS